ncbi:response regulator [Mesorhizobium sp. RSR565B]|uniref:response regulator n=1 Tax=Mesorhizobium sp. L103C565B0 TaxID=1287094 RepID=UPI0003CFA6E0|nr:response regulator [Mesorhizobium sp. L103C565B0]ESZ46287.1 chemotaxis protein CheY [Mesorhizobium sp. L103C565B0]
MSGIFLSHAVADRHLAELLVDFMMDAIGVPKSEIFCSSLTGFGIPLSHDFNEDMRDRIQQPKLVILLMTPAYMDSPFCLMEVGAAWVKAFKPLPVVVPPVTFAQVTSTIGLKQGWNITDSKKLQEVRDTVLQALGIQGHDNHTFDRKKEKWLHDLAKQLKKLAPSPKVARAELKNAEAGKLAAQKKLAAKAEENARLDARLEALKAFQPSALIIEDEPIIAMDIEELLTKQGFKVVGIARTEREALDLGLRLRPDIITTDIQLADGSSGIDAVNTILETINAGVVFVTAFPERLLNGNRPDSSYLVTKPFGMEVLAEKVKESYADLLRQREYIERK